MKVLQESKLSMLGSSRKCAHPTYLPLNEYMACLQAGRDTHKGAEGMVGQGFGDRGQGTLTAELLAAPAHVEPMPGTLVCIGGYGRAETLTVAP